MVSIWNSRPSSKYEIVLLAILFPLFGEAQLSPPIATVDFDHDVEAVSLDRNNNIFVADAQGSISIFDIQGIQRQHYSPQQLGRVTVLEAWNTVQIMLFYRDFQEIQVLDRFLNPIHTISSRNELIGFARNATPNLNRNYWIVDDVDFSLKLYDDDLKNISIITPLNNLLDPDDYELGFIREYQNLVFLNDKLTGILLFDNLGNYLETLPFPGLDYFGFLGNNLYFIEQDSLYYYDLYKRTSNKKSLPSREYRFALATDNRLILFKERAMEIYPRKED